MMCPVSWFPSASRQFVRCRNAVYVPVSAGSPGVALFPAYVSYPIPGYLRTPVFFPASADRRASVRAAAAVLFRAWDLFRISAHLPVSDPGLVVCLTGLFPGCLADADPVSADPDRSVAALCYYSVSAPFLQSS